MRHGERGEYRQVSMQPDLVFRDAHGNDRYVADIKYKLATDARARSDDYYQLLAYTTAMDLPAGMLIYCRHADDADHRTVVVRNAPKRLVVRTIDLTGSPDSVESEMTGLATAISEALRTGT